MPTLDKNRESGKTDLEDGINMGLYTYPILMSADILMFQSDLVPVGKDQIQHVEFARDIARSFNSIFHPTFKLPDHIVQGESEAIPGLDGRKMSKSYGNTIPLFAEPKKLRKLIMKIKTDSKRPEEPKDPDWVNEYLQAWNGFASIETLKTKFQQALCIALLLRALNIAYAIQHTDADTLKRWSLSVTQYLSQWMQVELMMSYG